MGAMKALLDAGADPTLRNPSGNSVLNLIVKRNNVEMAKAVIQSITDLDKKKEFVNSKSKIGN